MTDWSTALPRLEGILDAADTCLATGDLDGATAALDALGAPDLRPAAQPSPASAVRAQALGARLDATAASVRDAMARLRPELDLVTGASVSTRTTSRYLDQPL